MAGMMGVTAFLSMWINNSAATSIMLPVAIAISDELERHEKEYRDKKQAIKNATSAVNGKQIIKQNKWNEYLLFTEVLDLTGTEMPYGQSTKVILDAFHIEEPYVEKNKNEFNLNSFNMLENQNFLLK